MQAYALVRESKILQHLGNSELIKALLYCDVKGYLHYSYDGKKIIFVACAYMIPKFEEETCHVIPLKSEGTVLYIAWVTSIAKDATVPRKILSDYLREHPEAVQIVFYKGESKTPTIVNKKGEKSGRQEQETGTTANSSVSARPTV